MFTVAESGKLLSINNHGSSVLGPLSDDMPASSLYATYPIGDYDVYESRLRFKPLFEAHPQAMWVYHLEPLRFLVVNAAAVAQYGHTETELLQRRSSSATCGSTSATKCRATTSADQFGVRSDIRTRAQP
ncbi:hypothetical protein [Duganella sp. BuS-21]|uniref:hypothetical protein n=1 Tax=Duganella sp. BuS-21 TaxID=2943848 RepID=UPI0035A72799